LSKSNAAAADRGGLMPGSRSMSPEATRPYLGRRALVVETDPDTRRLAQEVLESMGFIVDVADNGVEAVSTARVALPELILLDLQLRDDSGLEVLRWLRANAAVKLASVIAISTSRDDLSDVHDARISVVLKKPLSAHRLSQAVDAAMKAAS